MAGLHTDHGERSVLQAAMDNLVYNAIRLYQNNYTPVPTSVLGDFTECDFSGYTSQALVAAAVFTNALGQAELLCGSFTSVRGNGAVDNDVYGVYATDGNGAVVYAERFAAPVPMVVPLVDTVFYLPRFTAQTP